MTYDSSGLAYGKVGEFAIETRVLQIAPSQFTATSRVPHGWGFGWFADDGNLTLLSDGVLHVTFPSNGIVEYWERDGPKAQVAQPTPVAVAQPTPVVAQPTPVVAQPTPVVAQPTPVAVAYALPMAHSMSGSSVRPLAYAIPSPSAPPAKDLRNVRVVVRRIDTPSALGSLEDLAFHWGVCVGDGDCYEVNGSMVVFGPKGVVAANSPIVARLTPTRLSQYAGWCDLGKLTDKEDGEIVAFTRSWIGSHPVYRIMGPNCQTYAEGKTCIRYCEAPAH